MKYLFMGMITISILFFTACSSKAVSTNTVKETKVSEHIEENDFLAEFDDELKVEPKSDPLSGYNRVMTNFNDGVYEYALSPIVKGYKFVVHKEIRVSIGNFFHNILYPIRLVNNLLQGKIQNSGEETGRFLLNSTVGLFGLFDPAKSYFGWEAHNEDLGQTLGYWGVGAGPHIVLPFFGPSNLRDMASFYPDSMLNPIDYHNHRRVNLTNNYGESLVVKAFNRVNYTSLHDGEYEKLKKDAVDLYPFLRDVYEQYREKQIKE